VCVCVMMSLCVYVSVHRMAIFRCGPVCKQCVFLNIFEYVCVCTLTPNHHISLSLSLSLSLSYSLSSFPPSPTTFGNEVKVDQNP